MPLQTRRKIPPEGTIFSALRTPINRHTKRRASSTHRSGAKGGHDPSHDHPACHSTVDPGCYPLSAFSPPLVSWYGSAGLTIRVMTKPLQGHRPWGANQLALLRTTDVGEWPRPARSHRSPFDRSGSREEAARHFQTSPPVHTATRHTPSHILVYRNAALTEPPHRGTVL